MSKTYVDLLNELYQITRGTALGGVLLETVGAAQEHGALTARIGVNRDRTFSVYCHDQELGRGVMQFLMQRTVPRLIFMPDFGLDDFRTMVRNPDTAAALGSDAPDELLIERWPRLSAMTYLRRQASKLRVDGKHEAADRLTAALSEPLCALSEGRFRTLLNELLGWKAVELDAAVAETLAWVMDAQPKDLTADVLDVPPVEQPG